MQGFGIRAAAPCGTGTSGQPVRRWTSLLPRQMHSTWVQLPLRIETPHIPQQQALRHEDSGSAQRQRCPAPRSFNYSYSSMDLDAPPGADIAPRRRFVWPKLSSPWHLRPTYQEDMRALHEEIVRRSQFTVQLGALYTLVRLASTHDDAKLCFSALEAVRLALIQRQQVKPFSAEFMLRLTHMIVRCDALDVLMAALPRTVELGLQLSLSSLHYLMAEYGNALRVDELAELMGCLDMAGIRPTTQTFYVVIRACINAGRLEQALHFYEQCRAHGLHVRPSVVRLLQQATGLHLDPAAGDGQQATRLHLDPAGSEGPDAASGAATGDDVHGSDGEAGAEALAAIPSGAAGAASAASAAEAACSSGAVAAEGQPVEAGSPAGVAQAQQQQQQQQQEQEQQEQEQMIESELVSASASASASASVGPSSSSGGES